jgi:hypothetical protein
MRVKSVTSSAILLVNTCEIRKKFCTLGLAYTDYIHTHKYIYIVACFLKARIVEPAEGHYWGTALQTSPLLAISQ